MRPRPSFGIKSSAAFPLFRSRRVAGILSIHSTATIGSSKARSRCSTTWPPTSPSASKPWTGRRRSTAAANSSAISKRLCASVRSASAAELVAVVVGGNACGARTAGHDERGPRGLSRPHSTRKSHYVHLALDEAAQFGQPRRHRPAVRAHRARDLDSAFRRAKRRDGGQTEVSCTLHDISERKRLESEVMARRGRRTPSSRRPSCMTISARSCTAFAAAGLDRSGGQGAAGSPLAEKSTNGSGIESSDAGVPGAGAWRVAGARGRPVGGAGRARRREPRRPASNCRRHRVANRNTMVTGAAPSSSIGSLRRRSPTRSKHAQMPPHRGPARASAARRSNSRFTTMARVSISRCWSEKASAAHDALPGRARRRDAGVALEAGPRHDREGARADHLRGACAPGRRWRDLRRARTMRSRSRRRECDRMRDRRLARFCRPH